RRANEHQLAIRNAGTQRIHDVGLIRHVLRAASGRGDLDRLISRRTCRLSMLCVLRYGHARQQQCCTGQSEQETMPGLHEPLPCEMTMSQDNAGALQRRCQPSWLNTMYVSPRQMTHSKTLSFK